MARLRLAFEALTCATVGDESSYIKNLRKLLVANSSPAASLLASYEWVNGLRHQIQCRIFDIACLGNQSLADMLTAALDISVLKHISQHTSGTCCVTGIASVNTITFWSGSTCFCLDSKFEFFLHALWVAANIPALEHSRILQKVDATGNASISDRIKAILAENQSEDESMLEVYTRAIDYTLASLDATIEHLSENVRTLGNATDQ